MSTDVTPRPGRWRAALLILPLLFGAIAWPLGEQRGPLWLARNSDPSYQYLLNSLLVFQGLPPCHVDHPGTTLQIVGARVIALTAPGATPEAQVLAVLSDPERSLAAIHRVLLALAVLACALAAAIVYERTGSVAHAALFQAIPLLQLGTYRATLFVEPEALLLPLTSLFAALVAAQATTLGPPLPRRSAGLLALLSGLIAGAALATKITFAPVCLLAVVGLRSWRDVAWFAAGLFAGLAIDLAPAFSQVPRMLQWFGQLASHSGTYGGGKAGFVDLAAYPANVGRMLLVDPLVTFLILGAGIAGSWLLRRRPDGAALVRLGRMLIALAAIQAVGLLLVAKHPHPRYLLPLALTVSLNAVLLAEAVRQALTPDTARRLGWRAAVLGVILLLATGSGLIRTFGELHRARDAQLRQVAWADTITRDARRIEYYRSSSPAFALHFGNGSAWRWFAPQLAQLHPDRIFLNVLTGRFETFSGPVAPESVLAGGAFYLVGDGQVDRVPDSVRLPWPANWRATVIHRDEAGAVHRVAPAP